jgi:two-component system sensor histidine kinase CpxA
LKLLKLKKIKIKLFWKILIIFWLISVTLFTFNLFFTHLNSDSIRYRKSPPHLTHQLKNTTQRIKKRFNNQRRQVRKHKKSFPNQMQSVYLIGKDEKDYFGKPINDMLYQLNKRVINKKSLLTAFRKKELYFGGLQIKLHNENYRIYISEEFSVLSRGYFSVFVREFSNNLLTTTLLISFPLSFLLAWLFSRPIKKLQKAINELSTNLHNQQSLKKLMNRSDEFGDLAKDFHAMTVNLNNTMESKARLLGDVSHELKSPLARLQIALALAEKKQSGNKSSELERIKLEANRMNDMISGLLDYAKIDTHTTLEKNTFNLAELILLLVDDANFESQQRNVFIKTEFEGKLYITAFKPMIISCLENILRNAIRYANQQIVISCKNETSANQSINQLINNIVITITDDGTGVENGQLIKIFDAFYRPELDRSRQSGGSGLGLSISKKVVEHHQGTIIAENTKPHGLKVTITIPMILTH